ncbi:hypothetical protein A2U01_0089240, partial [Trifolium medium]|nr:hypothetical protein [Trifolium medium]
PPYAFPTSPDVVLVLAVVLKVCKGREVVVHPVYWVVGAAAGFS